MHKSEFGGRALPGSTTGTHSAPLAGLGRGSEREGWKGKGRGGKEWGGPPMSEVH